MNLVLEDEKFDIQNCKEEREEQFNSIQLQNDDRFNENIAKILEKFEKDFEDNLKRKNYIN